MNKKQRDNRANQLNPNNPAYYMSRQISYKNKSKTHTKTVVQHHHHHDLQNLGKPCKICGRRGRIVASGHYAGCGYCGGIWAI